MKEVIGKREREKASERARARERGAREIEAGRDRAEGVAEAGEGRVMG
jgi:hypothetical protein